MTIKPRKKMMVTAYSIENEELAAELDYGIQVNVPLKEKEYAVYDTRQALLEAKQKGIVPFCLTVD